MKQGEAPVDDAGGGQTEALHARLLYDYRDLVSELGGDPAALLSSAGIGDEPPTYRQVLQLMEESSIALGICDFGMRLARRQRGGKIYGPLGNVMRHSRLFGDAIDYVTSHYHAHSLSARVWKSRMEGETATFVGHDILVENVTGKAQAIEQILLVGNYGAMEITGGYAQARRVHFRHQPVSPPSLYRRYFGCDVVFGQPSDGVFYSDADLACPIIDSDTEAYRAATDFIDAAFPLHRPPLQAEARALVMRLLGSDQCTNQGVAERLDLHPRTLHRRLRREGTSFQQLKDEVRRDLMLYYFRQTDVAFAAISDRLGFAEQSVMTRLSQRWFGGSPTRLRADARD